MVALQVLTDLRSELGSEVPGGDALQAAGQRGEPHLGRVLDEEVDMVSLAVGLSQRGTEVGTDVGHDLTHAVEHGASSSGHCTAAAAYRAAGLS